jgi:hypothetical protein
MLDGAMENRRADKECKSDDRLRRQVRVTLTHALQAARILRFAFLFSPTQLFLSTMRAKTPYCFVQTTACSSTIGGPRYMRCCLLDGKAVYTNVTKTAVRWFSGARIEIGARTGLAQTVINGTASRFFLPFQLAIECKNIIKNSV